MNVKKTEMFLFYWVIIHVTVGQALWYVCLCASEASVTESQNVLG